jgi:hypothetical protein
MGEGKELPVTPYDDEPSILRVRGASTATEAEVRPVTPVMFSAAHSGISGFLSGPKDEVPLRDIIPVLKAAEKSLDEPLIDKISLLGNFVKLVTP